MTNCGVFSGIVTYFSSHAEEKKDKVFELAPLHLDLLTILAEQIESLSDIKRISIFRAMDEGRPFGSGQGRVSSTVRQTRVQDSGYYTGAILQRLGY